jgi:hypothetical protein
MASTRSQSTSTPGKQAASQGNSTNSSNRHPGISPPVEVESNKRKRHSTSQTKYQPTVDSDDEDDDDDQDDNDESPYEDEQTAPPPKKQRSRTKRSTPMTQNKAKKLEAEIRRLKSLVTEQKKQLADVTTESILNARKGSKEIWDLTKITTEFKGLSKDVKNWTKKYSISKPISSLTDIEKERFLSECLDVSGTYFNVFSEADFPTIQILPKGAPLLLEGFIFAWATSYLIERRFFFLDDALKDHEEKPHNAHLQVKSYEEKFESFARELEKSK